MMFMTRKDRKIANQKAMINNRDKLIKDLQEQANIQYEEKKELEAKIVDLENNIEILVNNSNDTKLKELVRDYQSQN